MTAVERIVAALADHGSQPKQAGGSWSARCPAHEDSKPSLNVKGIEGKALVYCHAGSSCTTGDVMAALGLTLADLFDNRREVTYTYRDRAGNPTRRVHRPARQAVSAVG